MAPPSLAGYTAAKTALLGLMRSLAVDYGPQGIRVNAVCPGWVRTPMADVEMDKLAAARGLTREEAYEVAYALLPAAAVRPSRRRSPPCCLFLASRESSFVTGAVLAVDGGATAVDVGTLAFRLRLGRGLARSRRRSLAFPLRSKPAGRGRDGTSCGSVTGRRSEESGSS